MARLVLCALALLVAGGACDPLKKTWPQKPGHSRRSRHPDPRHHKRQQAGPLQRWQRECYRAATTSKVENVDLVLVKKGKPSPHCCGAWGE